MSSKPGFKVWDSIALADTEKICLQIMHKLDNLSQTNKIEVEDLPASLVPSGYLLDIVSCYDAMYNMLLERDLVLTGNLRSSNKQSNIH